MKKITLILLSVLLIAGLASCSKAPTAQDLMLEAVENTKVYNFDGNVGMEVVEEGISTTINVGLDGAVDGENMKASLNIGIPYMNLTGELYFIKEDLTLYMNIMGMWLKMDIQELAAEGMIDMEEFKALQNQKLTAETITGLGLTFSDVTEADGVYTFDIGYNKDIWKAVMKAQLEQQISDGTMTLPEGYTEDEFIDMILPVLDKLKITAQINKEDKTLRSMKADFMPVFEAIAQTEGIGEEIPVTKCDFEFNISDVGNVSEVQLDSSVADKAVDFIDFINSMNALTY
ncbi:MAG: hypothetical protein E7218_05050 [Anaerofustis stercorihominis]|nr:hypothetical protein [Anaerofustis stercorihominis]